MAGRLGLRKKRNFWLKPDLTKLRKIYPSAIRWKDLPAEFPGRTIGSISGKACMLRVRRPHRPPKMTGHELLDAIRFQSAAHRINMDELDEFAKSRSFFRTTTYKRRKRMPLLPLWNAAEF
jgi:hypothetical protein